jgi:predicted RNase H-like HicB family nuclease
MKYRIVIQWSDVDQVYVARVPALPGCAAHGKTPERAAKEARIAAEGILESMAEHGAPIPAPDVDHAFDKAG